MVYTSSYCYIIIQQCLYHVLQRRHNERYGISNHQRHDCLLNHLFRRRSKKTSKFCTTDLCGGNSSVTGEFTTQMASNAHKGPVTRKFFHLMTSSCYGTKLCTGYNIGDISWSERVNDHGTLWDGAQTLSPPMLTYHQLNQQPRNFVTNFAKTKVFSHKKKLWVITMNPCCVQYTSTPHTRQGFVKWPAIRLFLQQLMQANSPSSSASLALVMKSIMICHIGTVSSHWLSLTLSRFFFCLKSRMSARICSTWSHLLPPEIILSARSAWLAAMKSG